MPCGNGVARTSVAISKVDLLSGEVQWWSDELGGHDRGSWSTQIQLLTELVRGSLETRASLNACLWKLKWYFSRGMEVSHDKAPSRWLAPWHIAGPWTAWASVPSLWLHYCSADVNGDLYLFLFQTCTNRVIGVLLLDELH